MPIGREIFELKSTIVNTSAVVIIKELNEVWLRKGQPSPRAGILYLIRVYVEKSNVWVNPSRRSGTSKRTFGRDQ